jgi:rubrerythrin
MAAAIALCGLGFEGVHHLNGGILNWSYQTISGIPKARPELMTEAAQVRDILMLAIRLEKGSWDFYIAAGDKAKSPQAKETFQMLANAEDDHMQRLYRHVISLPSKEAPPPLDKLKQELKVRYMEGSIEINPALAKVDDKFNDEMEALEIALEKEYMSYDFYKRTAALVGSSDSRTLLHELALEERNHANTLLQRVAQVVRR